MSNDRNYFSIRNVARVDANHIRISGDLILKGEFKETLTWDAPANQTGDATKPPARMPSPREIKWRLPRRDSEFYSRMQSYAQTVGYQTVEHDDPTYSK